MWLRPESVMGIVWANGARLRQGGLVPWAFRILGGLAAARFSVGACLKKVLCAGGSLGC